MTIAADIEGAPPAAPPLALIHTTTVSNFRQICCRGALVPQTCPVMAANLTYFFYGRPAFRIGDIRQTDRDKDSRPVCLIFRRDLLPDDVGIYPCDTGAHHRGMYTPHLHSVDLGELECSAVPTAEGRIVSRYFETNMGYFYGEQRDVLTPDPTSAVAREFFNFLSSDGIFEYDDRCRTIEIIKRNEIGLADALQGVLFPDFLLADPDIAPWITRWKAEGKLVKRYRPQSQTCAAREVERRFPDIADIQGLPQ